jgi:mono/diheme cytochrome c family protein
MRKVIFIVAGCGLMLLAAACSGGQDSKQVNDAAMAPKDLYMNNCAACHGGNMEGSYGPSLKGIGAKLGKDKILAIIQKGKGSMPSQDHMSPQAQEKLAAWLAEQK